MIGPLRHCTLAIDPGTTRTRVWLKGSGLVVDEPSLAAVDMRTGELIAAGALAARMAGRTSEHIRVTRPFSGGGIDDATMGAMVLRTLLGDRLGERIRTVWRRQARPRAAVAVPYGLGPMPRQALLQAFAGAGLRDVEFVEAPLLAAVGSGLPVQHPEAAMVVICGATLTQVAVLSLGGVVAGEVIPVGGDHMDQALYEHLRHCHELMLPHQGLLPLHGALVETAGQRPRGHAEVHGKDVTSGLARSVRLGTEEFEQALREPLAAVVGGIGRLLRGCPPDLVVDIAERGIVLTGGSAVVPGLEALLGEATGMPVHVVEEPELAVIRGLGTLIESSEPPRGPAEDAEEPRTDSELVEGRSC
ncbi:rod shape-determining protein [Streptomyces sp. NPDC001941]|uniref:rod shape-determining protein n=1 Tax=Streptomyces sp. NPDC001941 TaxID=3154659 RepID=UPI00332E6DFF